MEQHLEMDVEEEKKQSKRKAEHIEVKQEEKEAGDTDEFFFTFFEHFTVPAQIWGCVNKVDSIGLAYLHKETNRPLLIVRLADPGTRRHIGYKIVFREEQDIEDLPCFNVYTDIKEADETEMEGAELKGWEVINYLAQLDEQYRLAGTIVGSEKYWPYYQEFLTLFFNDKIHEVKENAFKKRKKEKK